jgi:hypothetical protein
MIRARALARALAHELPRVRISVIVCAVCLLPRLVSASEPFTLTAQTTSGIPRTASVSANNVIDLVENVIQSQNQFTALAGQPFNATLRYGGLNNAVLFSRNADGTSGTLTIPSTGFSKTFTASNESDLRDQIRDFIKSNGAAEYAKFLQQINQRTTLGVADGNPLATTALMADRGFYRFGFRPARFELSPEPIVISPGLEVDLNGGVSNTDDADGWFGSLGLGTTIGLGDRIGLAVDLDLRYRDVDGAAVYQGAGTIGLPVVIIPSTGSTSLSWQLTPAFVSGFGGSWDLAAGGITVGGQLTSSLAYQNGPWTLTLADQIGFFEGVPIDVSDFRFETDVSQQIAKNGIQLTRTFGDAFVDASITCSNFLKEAAVDHYWTPAVGVGLRFGQSSGVRLGYHGDFADGFTNHGGDVELFFAF